MSKTLTWGHALRIALILALLGAAAFPLYWMWVTSLTPSSQLFAASPRLVPEMIGADPELGTGPARRAPSRFRS